MEWNYPDSSRGGGIRNKNISYFMKNMGSVFNEFRRILMLLVDLFL
jgi:hypothetical protein